MAYALMVRLSPMTDARDDTNRYLASMVEPAVDTRTDEQKRAALRAAMRKQQAAR